MEKRFHHYYLTEQLASKSLRSVFLAHHVSDASQEVVVKVFDSICLNVEQKDESLLQKVKWVKHFLHTHIVPVLDIGIEQGQPYIVSRYESSGSLRQLLNRLSPQHLKLQDALSIIFQVGRALRYAHEHNILHGNIKPENIFFDEQGKALLYAFVPSHSPGSGNTQATHITPTTQPQRDKVSPSSLQPGVQANLTWSYAPQTRNVYQKRSLKLWQTFDNSGVFWLLT